MVVGFWLRRLWVRVAPFGEVAFWGTWAVLMLRRVVPLWIRVKMLTSECSIDEGGGGELRAVEEGEIQVMYINVGGSIVAMHEFLERCARDSVAISFVGECWVEKKSGKGT